MPMTSAIITLPNSEFRNLDTTVSSCNVSGPEQLFRLVGPVL
jgi:hypothetical protein